MVTDSTAGTPPGGGLMGRLAALAPKAPEVVPEAPPVVPDTGLYSFSVEFYTDYRMIMAEFTSPERRLSDHLNGRADCVDIQPVNAFHDSLLGTIDLEGTQGSLMKSGIQFAIPLAEPPRPSKPDDSVWKSTARLECWVGIGVYGISGHIHFEADRDPRIAWKQIDKQFLPITQATIAFPDGRRHEAGAVLINRARVDVLTIKDRYAATRRQHRAM